MSSRALALLLLAGGLAAHAKELAIVGSARRVVDLDPASAESNCRGWSYDPMPLRDASGALSILYSTGDALTDHCNETDRFGDRIWRHTLQADGKWKGEAVLSRDDLDWMSSSTPDEVVGHLASPAVVDVAGRYVMAFVASVNDPHLCAGEHDAQNACGSCSDPWSYFTVMWAASDDGVHWTIRKRYASNANRAIAASVLWRPPSDSDRVHGSVYKGITHVSMLRDRRFFYLMTQVWTRSTVKSVLFRIAADPASEFGIADDDPEIWNGGAHRWEKCAGGRVPDWIDDANAVSVPMFGRPLSSIASTTAFPGYRYIGLAIGSGSVLTPRNNRIEYQLSNDLVTWTAAAGLRSAIEYVADGSGYENSVLTPAAAEDGEGKLHLYFASGDGDDDHGMAHDGLRDCSSDDAPTAIFVGSGIYETVAEPIELVSTTITIATKPAAATSGVPVTFTIRVNADEGKPNGVVFVTGPFAFSTVVKNGVGEITLPPVRFAGDFTFFAFFSPEASMWAASATPAPYLLHVAQSPPPPRRHGASH
jgi:hypothetical protein